jgi:serine/threonine protein kinase
VQQRDDQLQLEGRRNGHPNTVVKICDFGLAKIVADDPSSATTRAHTTNIGTVTSLPLSLSLSL